MFRFAGSRVAPAALFDASLLDFLKDRHDAVLFFVPVPKFVVPLIAPPFSAHFQTPRMPSV